MCLPNAGSGATVYRGWAGQLPSGTELLAVKYPGRQDRLAEPPIDDMERLVEQLAEALAPQIPGPFAIFGHSVGASIGHELALLLENRYDRTASTLFVSAGRAPGRGRPPQPAVVTEEALLVEIERLGGADRAMLADPEMRALVLPMLFADYRLRANYTPTLAAVSCPLVAYVGDTDPDCTEAETRMWAAATRDVFDHRVFPGDHFYLVPQEAALLADISCRLAALNW
ncbi:alpha/beta fold hydrolase [Plantactinospora sp. ZYX-F-223]|uniref:thioesterase II family protein n=1 Tax=Plantactinospora sp. ZYX-F-223 TaxID=3144103 RepID=UPI0031FDD95D